MPADVPKIDPRRTFMLDFPKIDNALSSVYVADDAVGYLKFAREIFWDVLHYGTGFGTLSLLLL